MRVFHAYFVSNKKAGVTADLPLELIRLLA